MDTERFWKLLQPFHPMAAAFCRKLAGDRDEGDDIYQEGLLAALRAFGGLKSEDAFRPWLFRILINTSKSRRRSFRRQRRAALTPDILESVPGENPRGRLDARHLLNRALACLRPDDRALVILHELQGWPLADLARMFKIPEGSVKNRLFRSKKKMRRELACRIARCANDQSLYEAAYAMQGRQTTDQ